MRIQVPVQLNVNNSAVSNSSQPPLSGFSVGDSVSATVVTSSPNGLVLQTPNGEILQGENLANVALQPGDQLDLLISSRNSSQLSVKLVSVNGQNVALDVDPVSARLFQLGVQPTAANLYLASVLSKAGAPLNAPAFHELTQVLSQFPSLPPETAAFAMANNLPLNEQTVPILVNITQNPPALGNMAQALEQLASQFPSQDTSPLQNQTFQAALSADQPVLFESMSKNPAFAQLADRLPLLTQGEAQTAVQEFVSSLPLPQASQNMLVQSLMESYSSMKTSSPIHTFQQADVASANPAGQEALGPILQEGQNAQEPALRQKEGSLKTPVPFHQSETASPPSQDVSHFLQTLSKLYAKLQPGAPLEQAVRNAIKDQASTASALHRQAVSTFGQDALISQQAKQLSSQVQLTDSFQNFSYFQLPFQFNEVKQTAELYVFEQKRRAKGDGDKTSSTVLVALDTENMGKIETVLRAQDGDLAIEMRVPSARVKKYLESSIVELSDSITSLKVTGVKISLIDEPVTPQNALALFGDLAVAPLEGINIEI